MGYKSRGTGDAWSPARPVLVDVDALSARVRATMRVTGHVNGHVNGHVTPGPLPLLSLQCLGFREREGKGPCFRFLSLSPSPPPLSPSLPPSLFLLPTYLLPASLRPESLSPCFTISFASPPQARIRN